MSTALGGISDPKPGFQNSADIDSLARFAVQQNNQKENGALEFVKVDSVKEQVVAGTMYYIILEAKDGGGETGTYEAKVWVKEWEKFKQLQGFKKLSGSDAASA